MPPSKRRQSNAMLYTLITFIGLFIVATTVAVIYYVRAEELRTQGEELQQRMTTLASSEEYRTLGTVVGTKLPGKTYFGTLLEHVDQTVSLVRGGPIQLTSAEVKVSNATQAAQKLFQQAQAYITLPVVEPENADPNAAVAADENAEEETPKAPVNRVAMTAVIAELLTELGNTIEQKTALHQQLTDLQGRFDAAVADMQETKDELAVQVNSYRQEVDQIKTDYNDLRQLVERNSEEQIKILLDQMEEAKASGRQLNSDLLKTQAELTVAQNRLETATKKINEVQPPPDQEAAACKPDGMVILVDDAAGVVRINLGSDDRVYRGLTFSVYDKSEGITKTGKPKAEIEVFAIDQRVSAARIMKSDRKNPVSTQDLVANLIWDCNRENQFVVAGEFDLNGNGTRDYDAIPRIETLIRKWGGAVSQDVSAKTDYVILGEKPLVPPEPTLEVQTVDPTAMEKYEAARQRLQRYEQVSQRAQSLWIPMFNYERFLHFTGYANQVNKPGAF